MKKIKRLTVGQLNNMDLLSLNEQRHIVGGSGCVWECLAWIMDQYDGKLTSNKERQEYYDSFQSGWASYNNGNVRSDGDPAANQDAQLYDYINQFFDTTTGSGWGTSGWGSMISSSGATNHANGYDNSGMALVVIGSGSDKHALVIYGGAQMDDRGNTYYECYDPDGQMSKVYSKDIQYGTGVSKKSE
jgi:hypothetical protein